MMSKSRFVFCSGVLCSFLTACTSNDPFKWIGLQENDTIEETAAQSDIVLDTLNDAPAPIDAAKPTNTAENTTTPTILRNNGSAARIAEQALRVLEAVSGSEAEIEAEQFSRQAILWEARPSISPEASITTVDNKLETRLNLQQTVYDFGRYTSRLKSADARIDIAKVKRWQERNEAVFRALERYADVLHYAALSQSAQDMLERHRVLKQQVQERFGGGFSERSEVENVDLRINEIEVTALIDQSEFDAASALLQSLIEQNVSIFTRNGTLSGVTNSLENPADIDVIPPMIQQAILEADVANAEMKETQSSRFPKLLTEAFISKKGRTENAGLGLRLDTRNFAGLSYSDQFQSASKRKITAEQNVKKKEEEHERNVNNLRIKSVDLETRRQILRQQIRDIEASIDLFFDQFRAGSRPILDALRVYETQFNAQRQLINIEKDILVNTLQYALATGTLAEFTKVEPTEVESIEVESIDVNTQ